MKKKLITVGIVFASFISIYPENGKNIFVSRGCSGCHTIGGGDRIGPDLKGVTQRRNVNWLRLWLKNPHEMIKSDPTAKALSLQYSVEMPDLGISDREIDSLIKYLSQN